ncbi:LytR C-terminal domain-containing protein [Glutamicibacter arilaitensis]|uniref:LytR C-terminal domain-containing protein n=1 Tax=Glutamicibacter arilaitensis TaxID=256701 RepID=UPI00384D5FC7
MTEPKDRRDPSSWHGQHIVSESELTFQSDLRAKKRRRTRQNVVFSVMASLVVLGFVAALLIFSGNWPLAKGPVADTVDEVPVKIENPVCPDVEFKVQDPASVMVRVLNTTGKSGLAGDTAEKLKERGFTITSISESASDYADEVGAVVAGPEGYAQALSIQRQLPGAVFVFDKDRRDARIDLEVGAKFEGLEKERKLNDAPGKLRCANSK